MSGIPWLSPSSPPATCWDGSLSLRFEVYKMGIITKETMHSFKDLASGYKTVARDKCHVLSDCFLGGIVRYKQHRNRTVIFGPHGYGIIYHGGFHVPVSVCPTGSMRAQGLRAGLEKAHACHHLTAFRGPTQRPFHYARLWGRISQRGSR